MDRTTRRLRDRPGIVLGLLPIVVVRGAPLGAAARDRRSRRTRRSTGAWTRSAGPRSSWERRPGPDRQVVDMVCLVPDLPTFLEAIAAWDEGHFFPILIDDVELTFKFLRRSARPGSSGIPRKVGADPRRPALGRAPSPPSAGRGRTRRRASGSTAHARRRGPAAARADAAGGRALVARRARCSPARSPWPRGGSSPWSAGRSPRHYADVLSHDEARAAGARPRDAGRRPGSRLRPARRRLRLPDPGRRLALSLQGQGRRGRLRRPGRPVGRRPGALGVHRPAARRRAPPASTARCAACSCSRNRPCC